MTAWQNISVEQNNDVTLQLSLTYNGAPFDPTAYTLTIYLKASETALDSTATTFTTSTGLTVVNATRGIVNWVVPHTATTTAGTQWWRIDAVDASSNRTTLIMGDFTVQAV